MRADHLCCSLASWLHSALVLHRAFEVLQDSIVHTQDDRELSWFIACKH
jgi:hypothetical protein